MRGRAKQSLSLQDRASSAEKVPGCVCTLSIPHYSHVATAYRSVSFQRVVYTHLSSMWTDSPSPALLSVYDKTGLLPFAKGLDAAGVKLLGSGGTAKAIRNAGMDIK